MRLGNSSSSTEMDNKGQLMVTLPPDQPLPFMMKIVWYTVVPVVLPVIVTYKFITDKSYRSTTAHLYSLVNGATINPISTQWYFQDAALLKKLWSLPSAQAYIDKESNTPLLEYQVREGYCGSATQRCILKSLGFPSNTIPDQKSGESKPDIWCDHVRQIASESTHNEQEKTELTTNIVRGDASYEEFLSTLKRGLEDENCRVACNFLRSALTGFEAAGLRKYLPITFFIKIYGGHFSPILGIVEQKNDDDGSEDDDPLVAIWDTNHKYGGAYFVPARRLHDAVASIDLGAKMSRAIILVEKKVCE